MKRIALGVLVASIASAAGCAETRVSDTMINPPPHAMWQRPPETVEIYASGPPARAHVDVGYLEAKQGYELADKDSETFITELRGRAAELGCDALVLGGGTSEGTRTWNGTRTSLKGMTAVCVVYTDSNSTGRAPLAAASHTAQR